MRRNNRCKQADQYITAAKSKIINTPNITIMNTLNNILRNTLPAFATATIIAFGLTSCSQETELSNEIETPVNKVVDLSTSSDSPAKAEASVVKFEEGLADAPDTIATAQAEISIIKAVACAGIENHEPVDPSTDFEVYDDKIWVYTKVKMPKGQKGVIQHVYYLNDKKIQTIDLKVKGPTFRTRSYKTMNANLCGEWKVEILNESGELLDTVEFSNYETGGC